MEKSELRRVRAEVRKRKAKNVVVIAKPRTSSSTFTKPIRELVSLYLGDYRKRKSKSLEYSPKSGKLIQKDRITKDCYQPDRGLIGSRELTKWEKDVKFEFKDGLIMSQLIKSVKFKPESRGRLNKFLSLNKIEFDKDDIKSKEIYDESRAYLKDNIPKGVMRKDMVLFNFVERLSRMLVELHYLDQALLPSARKILFSNYRKRKWHDIMWKARNTIQKDFIRCNEAFRNLIFLTDNGLKKSALDSIRRSIRKVEEDIEEQETP